MEIVGWVKVSYVNKVFSMLNFLAKEWILNEKKSVLFLAVIKVLWIINSHNYIYKINSIVLDPTKQLAFCFSWRNSREADILNLMGFGLFHFTMSRRRLIIGPNKTLSIALLMLPVYELILDSCMWQWYDKSKGLYRESFWEVCFTPEQKIKM